MYLFIPMGILLTVFNVVFLISFFIFGILQNYCLGQFGYCY